LALLQRFAGERKAKVVMVFEAIRRIGPELAAVASGAAIGISAGMLGFGDGLIAAGLFGAAVGMGRWRGLGGGLLAVVAGVVGRLLAGSAPSLLGPVIWLASGSLGAVAGAVWASRRSLSDQELAIFDAIPLTAILYDPATLRIVRANPAARAYLGYPVAELRGMTIDRLVTPEEVPRMHNYLKATAEKPIRQIRWTIRRADGSTGEFEVISSRFELGGRLLRLVIGIDLSNYLKLGGRLKRAAQEAREAKAQFLALAGHELRTPMMAIAGAAQALEADHLSWPQRELVATIRRNAELETRLLEDMIDYIRGERRSLRLDARPVDVHEEIRAAVQSLWPEIQQRRQRLELDLSADPPYAFVDPARLQQVLLNLLRNATKFTPAEGLIRVATYVTEPAAASSGLPDPGSDNPADGEAGPMVPLPGVTGETPPPRPGRSPQTPVPNQGLLVVEISDTGVGIEPAELDRIFDPFRQGETTRRLWGEGLGLGLAISRAIAVAHGGRLIAESEGAGRGSTFRLELVRVSAPKPDPNPNPIVAPDDHRQPPPPPRRLAILLVDDNEDIRRGLARLLEMRGHRVTVAGDQAAALQALRSGRFDVLISDLELEDGTGYELLDALRQGGCADLPPAIALSGYDAPEDRLRSREAGFAAHLAKPVEVSRLDEALRTVVAQNVQTGPADR
jgi:PAS domain S-box-containing protein